MANMLFTNVRIIDGTGAAPYRRRGAGPGQSHRARGRAAARSLPAAGVTVDRRAPARR